VEIIDLNFLCRDRCLFDYANLSPEMNKKLIGLGIVDLLNQGFKEGRYRPSSVSVLGWPSITQQPSF
jgi:hypothetical protein